MAALAAVCFKKARVSSLGQGGQDAPFLQPSQHVERVLAEERGQVRTEIPVKSPRSHRAQNLSQNLGAIWPRGPRSTQQQLLYAGAGWQHSTSGQRGSAERCVGTGHSVSEALVAHRGHAGDKHHDHSDAQAWPRVQRYLQPQ
jgi:hypothetical protein